MRSKLEVDVWKLGHVLLLVVGLSFLEGAAGKGNSPAATSVRPAATGFPAQLTASQQKVVDYLVADWDQPTHVTSISLAMSAVGGDWNGNDRYAIGTHLRDHPEVHRVLRRFGWETVTLDPHEKQIARLLSRAERETKPAPSVNELAQALERQPEAIASGLRMLEWFGITRKDATAGGVGYRMATPRYLNWESAARITFVSHRVHVEGQHPFEVFCAIDFLALIHTTLQDKKVTVEDSSLYSGRPVRVEFENGKVAKAQPPTARVFHGGGCGLNNLFRSEEEASTWQATHPELADRKSYSIQEYMDKLRSGEIR